MPLFWGYINSHVCSSTSSNINLVDCKDFTRLLLVPDDNEITFLDNKNSDILQQFAMFG